MEQELPECMFRDFRKDAEHQTISWINAIATLNANPETYYPKIL